MNHNLDATISTLSNLIRFPSVSSTSNQEISSWLAERLTSMGCQLEVLSYIDDMSLEKVSLVAKLGDGAGGLAYFGHSDVVPAEDWATAQGPFEPYLDDGRLYGRGSCDMKGSVSCFLTAMQQHHQRSPDHGPIYFLCTADEEIGFKGAEVVVRESKLYAEMVEQNVCGIVGEPTLLNVVHAHKGIVVLKITSYGVAAHSSTTKGDNANWKLIPVLNAAKELYEEVMSSSDWMNDEFTPNTIGWNLRVNDGVGAVNITAAQSDALISFRPMPGQNASLLIERVRDVAVANDCELSILQNSPPFGRSRAADWTAKMLQLTGHAESLTVSYGTDASCFETLKSLVICGPGSIEQAHTNTEFISLEQLQAGYETYLKIIESCC